MRGNKHSPALLGLPDEVILMVLARLEWSRDLNSVTRTCRRLFSLCDPILYHRIVLDNFEVTKSFVTALRAQPSRARNVHTLWTYMKRLTGEQVHSLMADSLDASTLSYDDEINRFGEIFTSDNIKFRNGIVIPTLPALVNCRLQFLGSYREYWPACYTWPVFLHPTLQHLTLTRADLCVPMLRNPSSTRLRSRFSTTPLKSLVLKDCFIYPADLRGIVAFPSALKRLFLSDGLPFHWSLGGHPPETAHLIEALAALHRTLEMLTIERLAMNRTLSSLVMKDFSALLYLRISICQLLGKPGLLLCMQRAELDMEAVMAPNLEILELTIIEWRHLIASTHLLSQIMKVRKAGKVLQRLRAIELVWSERVHVELNNGDSNYVVMESIRNMEKLRGEFDAAGVNIGASGVWGMSRFEHADHLTLE